MPIGSMPEITAGGVADDRPGGRRALRKTLLERRLLLTTDDWRRLSACVCAHLDDGFPHLSALAVAFLLAGEQ